MIFHDISIYTSLDLYTNKGTWGETCFNIFPVIGEAIYIGTGGGRTFSESTLIEHFNCSEIDVVTWMCRVFFFLIAIGKSTMTGGTWRIFGSKFKDPRDFSPLLVTCINYPMIGVPIDLTFWPIIFHIFHNIPYIP